MSVQQFLQTLVVNARKPGVLKSVVGQLAIAYGANMVAESAAAAEERAERAAARLEDYEAGIVRATAELTRIRERGADELHRDAEAMVADGFIDKAVRARAAVLGMVEPPAEPPADAAEPQPPCANPHCSRDYNHPGKCVQLVSPFTPTGPADVGLLAGDGSDERPFRTVDTIASVLDDPDDDDDPNDDDRDRDASGNFYG